MNAQPTQIDSAILILTEAERLFRHYGYTKTTMADIADACNMSAANLYRFYPSKSALMEAICTRITSTLEARLSLIVRGGGSASERFEKLVLEVNQYTLENLLDHRKVHEMVVIAMQEQWHAVRAHLARVALHIEQIIKDGIAAGEFQPQADTLRTAKCVHSAMAALCHPVVVAQKLDDDDRPMPQEMVALLLNALKAKS